MLSLDWDNYRVFVETFRTGSLAGAAQASNLSVPTVRRRLEALEDHFGIRLFERSARGLRPTPAARRLAEFAVAMGETAEWSWPDAETTPTVVVEIDEATCLHLLNTALAGLRSREPDVRIEVFTVAGRAFPRRKADISVTVGPPRDHGEEVAETVLLEVGLYAARSYLARAGVPDSPGDLQLHTLIGSECGGDDNLTSLGLAPTGETLMFRTDSAIASLRAAEAGVGLCAAFKLLAEQNADLVRVLPALMALTPVRVALSRRSTASSAALAAFDAILGALRHDGA